MQLAEKSILVTGSTTGIGEAIARCACREGANVMLHGREIERGHALVAELGPQAKFVAGDLSDAAVPATLVQAAVEAFGRLDGIVNNDLKESRGCVLNIGSMNAYTGESNLLAYSVSKGALMTLSRNLADALCYDGVRVNHFNVGWVLTPNEYHYKVNDGLPADWPDHVPAQFAPRGKLMKPEEIAAAAIYWLSNASRPFSGSVVDLEQYPFVGRNPTKRGD
jgi:NAD(P)-dependent dehydrogenase (short-subunit alcohol dehydrogenase family)